MYLYQFELSSYGNIKILRKVVEVVEEPMTYRVVRSEWPCERIFKSNIGILKGYKKEVLYLLEDDIKKATQIFVESLKNKIESERECIQDLIKSSDKRITEYENAIKVLSK